MVNDEDWVVFITSFFKVDTAWLAHVTSNWNPLKKEPGCNCQVNFGAMVICDDYIDIVAARKEIEKLNSVDLSTIN